MSMMCHSIITTTAFSHILIS